MHRELGCAPGHLNIEMRNEKTGGTLWCPQLSPGDHTNANIGYFAQIIHFPLSEDHEGLRKGGNFLWEREGTQLQEPNH